MKYEDHPIAAIFPLLPEAELKELAEDIEARGLLQPILLHEGKILDGRNRYRACQMCGVEPETAEYVGTDPVKDTLSLNLHRRHLSESQRAMIAAKLANLDEGRPSVETAETQQICRVSQSEAAEQLQVSTRSVTAAKKVLNESPALAEQVAAGTITVHAAQKAIAEAAESPAPVREKDVRSHGLRYSLLAIQQLEKIHRNDTQRQEAFDEVARWIEANR